MRFFVPYGIDSPLMCALCDELELRGHTLVGGAPFHSRPPGQYESRAEMLWLRLRTPVGRKTFDSIFGGIAKRVPLSARDMDGFTGAWDDYCAVIDRWYLKTYPMSLHTQFFHDGLSYSLGLFKQHKIDALLYLDIPHHVMPLLMYHAARNLGLKTVYIQYALQSLFVREHWDGEATAVPDETFEPEQADESHQRYYEQILKGINYYQPQPDFTSSKNRVSEIRTDIHNQKDVDQAEIVGLLLAGPLAFHKMAWPAKQVQSLRYILQQIWYHCRIKKEKAFTGGWRSALPETNWPRWRSFWLSMRNFRHGKVLFKEYEKLSVKPDLKAPYIYLALHQQPEASTLPSAGYFREQYLAASLLAESLPPGWRLYVKEHPVQFRNMFPFVYLDTYVGRDADEYRRFSQLPATSLVSMDVLAPDLVRNAQICATVSGTVGVEALVQGKPVITFSNAYYNMCKGVRRASSHEECAAAIAELRTMPADAIKKSFRQLLAGVMRQRVVDMCPATYSSIDLTMLSEEERCRWIKGLGDAIEARFIAK